MSPSPAEMFANHIDLADGPADRLPTHGGVYLVADANGAPILLAAGEDLRRVVAARLAEPPPDRKSRRTNLARIARTIFWTPTFSRFETKLRYHALARRLYPKTVRDLLDFGPAWFIRADPTEDVPRMTAVREYPDDGARYVGPVPTRRDAEESIRLLEDLFDLCRKYDVLRRVPHGQPCEYFEMGRCPAPCDGRVPMSAYRDEIARAIEYAAARRIDALEPVHARMRAAAAELAFEKAAAIRETIERAAAHFARPELRLLADLADFRWLVLQRGGPRSRSPRRLLVKPFYISPAGLAEGDPVALTDLPNVAESWLTAAATAAAATEGDVAERSERIWLTAHFLLKGSDAPGLFYRATRLPTAGQLVSDANARIGRALAEDEPTPQPAARPTRL